MLQDSRVHKSLLNFFKNLKKTPSEPQLVTSVDGRPLVLARLPSNLVVDDDPAVNAAQIYGTFKEDWQSIRRMTYLFFVVELMAQSCYQWRT